MHLKLIKEGKVKLLVPDPGRYSREGFFDPAWAPVFYNPRAEIVRDLDVLFLQSYITLRGIEGAGVIDALSATGIRGIRYLVEVEGVGWVHFNDMNSSAVELIRKNVKLNAPLKAVKITNLDANEVFLDYIRRGETVKVIDIDPYGPPTPFIDLAVEALKRGGLLCVTATDLSVLYGVYPLKCLRRYFAHSFKSPFSHEIGLRILIGYIVRSAASRDVHAIPLLSYFVNLYLRTYFELKRGGSKASEALLNNMGYVVYCRKCLYRAQVPGTIYNGPARCPICDSELTIAGPLWVGDLGKRIFCDAMLDELKDRDYRNKRTEEKLLRVLGSEVEYYPPYFYEVSEIGKLLKVNEPSPKRMVGLLKEAGFRATLTHFSTKGFKTDASIEDIVEVMRGVR